MSTPNGAASAREIEASAPDDGHMDSGIRLENPDQLAERWGVPASWIRQEARAGRLPSLKLGHYRRFIPAEVDAYLEHLREGR